MNQRLAGTKLVPLTDASRRSLLIPNGTTAAVAAAAAAKGLLCPRIILNLAMFACNGLEPFDAITCRIVRVCLK